MWCHARRYRPVSTQENKQRIGSDWNKIEPAHGILVPIFCSSLNLWSCDKSWSIFNFFGPAVRTIQDEESPVWSDPMLIFLSVNWPYVGRRHHKYRHLTEHLVSETWNEYRSTNRALTRPFPCLGSGVVYIIPLCRNEREWLVAEYFLCLK